MSITKFTQGVNKYDCQIVWIFHEINHCMQIELIAFLTLKLLSALDIANPCKWVHIGCKIVQKRATCERLPLIIPNSYNYLDNPAFGTTDKKIAAILMGCGCYSSLPRL